ncbi:MAG TPA: MFS transporter [Victivallales bacterium]|nr:MFS transporter [Victivallales bacterium]
MQYKSAQTISINREWYRSSAIKPWLIWMPAAFFTLYIFFLQTSISYMIEPLKQYFSISNAGIGILSASFFYTYIFLQIPMGSLVDKYGVRKIIIISTIGCAATCVSFAISQVLMEAVISRIFMGLFACSAFTCAFTIAAKWFPSKMFPLIVGLTEMSGMLGGAFSEKILSNSVIDLGWRNTIFLCALIAMVIAVLTIFYVKDRPKKYTANSYKIAEQKKNSVLTNIKVVMSYKQVWYLSIYAGLVFIPLASFAALWGTPFIMHKYHVGLIFAAECMAMIFIGSAVGNPSVAWFAETYNKKKETMIFCSIMLITLMIVIIYVYISSMLLLLILMFAAGFFCSVYVIPFSLSKKILPKNVCGTGMAFVNAICGGLGSLILQPIIGWVLNINSSTLPDPSNYSYHIALSIIPLCLIISLIIIWKIEFKKAK